jgi:signal transduction histidine kinase
MGAGTALSCYILLIPLYLQSRESLLGKLVILSYPVGDLAILFGLTITLICRWCQMAPAALVLLVFAFICLFAADSWVAWLLLYDSYQTGGPPDLFWMACYLLVPLAGLVLLRLTQRTPAPQGAQQAEARLEAHPERQDLKEAFQFLFPFVAALLVSAMIGMRVMIAPAHPLQSLPPLLPSLMIFGLLLLVIVRQGITVLEQARLRREREVARTNELAVREANRQMEAFLGIVSHELRTPLTSIIMGLQISQRRTLSLLHALANPAGDVSIKVASLHANAETTLHQSGRLNRLVNDLLDMSRIQAGQLAFQFTRANLDAIVRTAVEEQRQAVPERQIQLHLPEREPLWVEADAQRIGQVVTNYLTNALKYADEARPVEVGVQEEGLQGRLWVRDQGPGIAPSEQARIWEHFHRVPGVEVQSGSGIGLGLGLYISRAIIASHHGQVGVESVPGQGAMFWFTLPLAVPKRMGKGEADGC